MCPRILGVSACVLIASATMAQPTAFTYQGRLKNGPQPAADTHDFRFTLFNAASGGTQVGTTQCADNLAVSDGVFAATIDFGPQFATAEPRFLQIEVRADSGLTCGNLAGFVTLAPRQPISPAPAAIHAHAAFSLDAPDGSPANAVFVDNDGRVGIGTTSPLTSLHVAAPLGGSTPGEGVRIQGTATGVANQSYLSFDNSAGAQVGYVGDGGTTEHNIQVSSTQGNVILYTAAGPVLNATAAGRVGIGIASPVSWLDVQGSNNSNIFFGRRTGGGLAHNLFIEGNGDGGMQILDASATPRVQFRSGNNTYFNFGNVGIGTTTPIAKLDVRGNIQLGANAEYSAPGASEHLRIVRGNVDGNGVPSSGTGFTASRAAQGVYIITFTPSFAGTPSVIATAHWPTTDSHRLCEVRQGSVTQGSVTIDITRTGTTTLVDSRFSFIAIGARF